MKNRIVPGIQGVAGAGAIALGAAVVLLSGPSWAQESYYTDTGAPSVIIDSSTVGGSGMGTGGGSLGPVSGMPLPDQGDRKLRMPGAKPPTSQLYVIPAPPGQRAPKAQAAAPRLKPQPSQPALAARQPVTPPLSAPAKPAPAMAKPAMPPAAAPKSVAEAAPLIPPPPVPPKLTTPKPASPKQASPMPTPSKPTPPKASAAVQPPAPPKPSAVKPPAPPAPVTAMRGETTEPSPPKPAVPEPVAPMPAAAKPKPAPAAPTTTALTPPPRPTQRSEPAPVQRAEAPPPPPAPDKVPPATVAKPKPAPAPAPQVASRTMPPAVLKPGTAMQVVFAGEASKLPANAKTGLETLAKEIEKTKDLRLQLLAYAGGESLSTSKARRISLSRALSVRSQLIESGLRSTRIDVRALGDRTKEEPMNRVDVVVINR